MLNTKLTYNTIWHLLTSPLNLFSMFYQVVCIYRITAIIFTFGCMSLLYLADMHGQHKDHSHTEAVKQLSEASLSSNCEWNQRACWKSETFIPGMVQSGFTNIIPKAGVSGSQ